MTSRGAVESSLREAVVGLLRVGLGRLNGPRRQKRRKFVAMIKAGVVYFLLTISLAGGAYGALCHSRFIKAGGQYGFSVVKRTARTESMRGPHRGMVVGYSTFMIAAALMLVITGIWGPV